MADYLRDENGNFYVDNEFMTVESGPNIIIGDITVGTSTEMTIPNIPSKPKSISVVRSDSAFTSVITNSVTYHINNGNVFIQSLSSVLTGGMREGSGSTMGNIYFRNNSLSFYSNSSHYFSGSYRYYIEV